MKSIHLTITIGLALAIASCSTKKETEIPTAKQVKYVKSVKVEEQNHALPVYAFGKLSAKEESKLSFKIGGIIQAIYVDKGQRVKKGQILARLDQKEINAQVASARASLEKWDRDLQRMERLLQEKVVTLESYQNVKTQHDVAVSNLQIAEFNQKYSTIVAPMNGRVLRKYAEENELTNAGSPVFMIGSSGSQMIVKAGLTDKEVFQLATGDSAVVQFDAVPDVQFTGSILLINSAPDVQSGLYETEILINEQHSGLRNGFFAKVKIYPSKVESFKFLPIESLVQGNKDQGTIYAIDENRAVKVNIDILGVQEDQLIVRNDPGLLDEIVIEGAQYLEPGDELIVVNN